MLEMSVVENLVKVIPEQMKGLAKVVKNSLNQFKEKFDIHDDIIQKMFGVVDNHEKRLILIYKQILKMDKEIKSLKLQAQLHEDSQLAMQSEINRLHDKIQKLTKTDC